MHNMYIVIHLCQHAKNYITQKKNNTFKQKPDAFAGAPSFCNELSWNFSFRGCQEQLSLVLVTSPVPSNPSTELLEHVLNSFFAAYQGAACRGAQLRGRQVPSMWALRSIVFQ